LGLKIGVFRPLTSWLPGPLEVVAEPGGGSRFGPLIVAGVVEHED